MVPALLAESGVVSAHHPLGASTGYMEPTARRLGGDGRRGAGDLRLRRRAGRPQRGRAARAGGVLRRRARAAVRVPERARAREAPAHAGGRAGAPARRKLAPVVDAIVVHPDAMDDPRAYRALGSCLVLENMDARKPTGRTVAELAPLFAALPEAGFCLDVAHVLSVDPTMAEGERLLDAFAGRLRHLHVSSIDEECRHLPLTAEHEARFPRCCGGAPTCPGSSRRRSSERPRPRRSRRRPGAVRRDRVRCAAMSGAAALTIDPAGRAGAARRRAPEPDRGARAHARGGGRAGAPRWTALTHRRRRVPWCCSARGAAGS